MHVKRQGKRENRQHWFEKNAYEIFRDKIARFTDSYIQERYEIERLAKAGNELAAEILLKKYHARVLTSI